MHLQQQALVAQIVNARPTAVPQQPASRGGVGQDPRRFAAHRRHINGPEATGHLDQVAPPHPGVQCVQRAHHAEFSRHVGDELRAVDGDRCSGQQVDNQAQILIIAEGATAQKRLADLVNRQGMHLGVSHDDSLDE